MNHKNHHILFFLFLSFVFPILLSYTLIPSPSSLRLFPYFPFHLLPNFAPIVNPMQYPLFPTVYPFYHCIPVFLKSFFPSPTTFLLFPNPNFPHSPYPFELYPPLFKLDRGTKKIQLPPQKKKKKYCMKGITILYFILYFQKTL